MLVIRKVQKQMLARDLFDRWIVTHVERAFPRHCREVGQAQVRAEVSEAARAAQERGFQSDEGVALFVCLTFMFGSGFHESARYPWARSTIRDGSGAAPRERVERLRAAALEHIRLLESDAEEHSRNASPPAPDEG